MEFIDNSYIKEIVLEYMEDELEDRKRLFKNQLKKLSDEELSNAIVNINIDSWKYELLKNEVKRRYILRI